MARQVKVLIADDEEHVRNLLRVVCDSISGITVIGEAADGKELMEKFSLALPDVVLLDINMPHVTGIEALAQIRDIDPNVAVVMLTSLNSSDVVRQCISGGAKTYILKNNSTDKIRNAIKQVAFDQLRRVSGA